MAARHVAVGAAAERIRLAPVVRGTQAESMTMREVFHMRVFFEGRVQGVGFRYRTLQIARGFEVSGTVRNLPDGRVELEAEGLEGEVRAFVAEVAERLDVFIRHTQSEESVRQASFSGFRIG